jgi:hypothetical protein
MKRYVDYIRDIIVAMSADDCKEFKVFVQRQRNRKQRVDLQLFEILRKDENLKASQICELIYKGGKGMNAYHSIRKRLLKQLMEFSMLKRMEEDTTSASSIMGLLSIAQFLFDKGSDDTAWYYLKKCEEMALTNEQYDLLDNVYNMQISNASSSYAPPLQSIITNWKENKSLADEDERANVANTIIRMNLEKYRLEGGVIDIRSEINNVLEEYELNDVVFKRPKVLYNFLSIIRSEVLATKDYFSIQQVIIDLYKEMDQKNLFQKKDHFYKLSILYMICHVLYRNRKFQLAIEYLDIFKEEILAHKQMYYQRFYPKYLLIYAAVKSYQGENKVSIDLLENFLKDWKSSSIELELDTKLNLAVYYFQQENFSSAIRTIVNIGHTDGFCVKKMGKEWLMRKNLIELLTQYEKGNTEIAMQRIKQFRISFKEMLSNPMYIRITTFLGFVEQCINKPYWVASQEFMDHVYDTLDRWPLEKEDLQAMAFYCWLKSKMLKDSYYHVLVETVNGKM